MSTDIAIKVENVSKTFRIPHEKISSLRGAFVSAFKKKTYEKFKALDNVSFEVKKGEFFGIIGRNGSGKSTLLKILAGIYQSDNGKIHINGRISPFLELGIGFNPELSGRDNIYLNATVLGLTRRQIDHKFADIVRFSELERFIDQKLKNYSSGMQVRLAFSVAIHANRDILLMDEVLAVGDANFQLKCLEEFNYYRKLGKTILLVSHDISKVRQYCDHALLLDDGKVISVGDTDLVCDTYRARNYNTKIALQEKKLQTSSETVKSAKDIGRIKQVRVLKNMNAETHFDFARVGDDLFVEIDAEIKDGYANKCALGILFEDRFGNYIFGCNTVYDNKKINTDNKAKYVHLKHIALLPKKYFITVSLYDKTNDDIHITIKRAAEISIRGDINVDYERYRGQALIDHEWIV